MKKKGFTLLEKVVGGAGGMYSEADGGLMPSSRNTFRKVFSLTGFTIIELLIVIAVIAILVGIALPRFKGMQDEGKIVQTKAELRTLQTAVESYYMHNKHTYPDTGSADLQTALSTAKPSIINYVPTDPFSGTGADYEYVMGGTDDKFYIIYSVGPSGDGSARITLDAVEEVKGTKETVAGDSCIYVSNISQDTQP